MNRLLSSCFAVSMFALSACGTGPDSSALVNGGSGLEAETEFDTTADALLSNSASVWFPMQEGNTWTLESSSGAKKVLTFSGVGDDMALLDGLTAGGEWTATATSAPNTLYRWDDAKYAWGPYFRFGYAVTPWTIGSGACGTFTLKRTATDVGVVVSAGSFSGARTIGYTMVTQPNVRCVAPAVTEITFAPNVGPVMLRTGLGEKFTLKTANVGGVAYPRTTSAQARGTLKADKSSYVNQSNTIRCITTPCPSNEVTAVAKLTFTVTNTGTSPITWQFSSGKQYDIDVVNSSGKVVRRWSDGRAFTMALTTFTLAAGSSKTFSAEVALKDTAGIQLDGSYTLKAYLVPRSLAPTAAAQTGISVTVN